MDWLSELFATLLAYSDEQSTERKFQFVCGLAVIVLAVCVGSYLWFAP